MFVLFAHFALVAAVLSVRSCGAHQQQLEEAEQQRLVALAQAAAGKAAVLSQVWTPCSCASCVVQ